MITTDANPRRFRNSPSALRAKRTRPRIDPIVRPHPSYTRREARHGLAKCGEKLVTALQNAAEFWNVCTRPITAKGGYGLSVAETELRLQDLEQGFSLLFEPHATYSIWRDYVVSLSVKGKQVHDGRLAALMKANGTAHILTLNGSDFVRYPGITVIHPADVTATP